MAHKPSITADAEPWTPTPTDAMAAAVVAILDRVSTLTSTEAVALDAALRGQPELWADGLYAMGQHERFVNHWAMFDHWSHPWDEMVEAHVRVATAVGGEVQVAAESAGSRVPTLPTGPMMSDGSGPRSAFPEDDGSVAWGASMAVALAVLSMGHATSDRRFREPWDAVMGDVAVDDRDGR